MEDDKHGRGIHSQNHERCGFCSSTRRRTMSCHGWFLLMLLQTFSFQICCSFQQVQSGVSKESWQYVVRRADDMRTQARSFTLYMSNSGNSGTMGSSKDPVLRLPMMEAELAMLLENSEDGIGDDDDSEIRQQNLQDAIADAKTAAEFGVRKAQLEFYDAFSQGDIDAMGKVWSRDSHVRCVHPGMTSLEGRDKVMASWRQIFEAGEGDSSFEIEPTRSRVEVHGLIAMCSCVEKTQGGGTLEALNIYKRENGSWKMTLHMASPTMVSIRRGGESSSFF